MVLTPRSGQSSGQLALEELGEVGGGVCRRRSGAACSEVESRCDSGGLVSRRLRRLEVGQQVVSVGLEFLTGGTDEALRLGGREALLGSDLKPQSTRLGVGRTLLGGGQCLGGSLLLGLACV